LIMAYSSDSTVVSTLKITITGSDTKNHSVTFPNAKTDLTIESDVTLISTAGLFGNTDGYKEAVHDVIQRKTYER